MTECNVQGVCKVEAFRVPAERTLDGMGRPQMHVRKPEQTAKRPYDLSHVEVVGKAQHPFCLQKNRIGNEHLFPLEHGAGPLILLRIIGR